MLHPHINIVKLYIAGIRALLHCMVATHSAAFHQVQRHIVRHQSRTIIVRPLAVGTEKLHADEYHIAALLYGLPQYAESHHAHTNAHFQAAESGITFVAPTPEPYYMCFLLTVHKSFLSASDCKNKNNPARFTNNLFVLIFFYSRKFILCTEYIY